MPSTSRSAATRKPATATATATAARTSKAPARTVSHDDIASLAYELYVKSGCQPGREVEFWLEAERELKDRLDV
jgi:hypothetical protein